MSRVKRQPLGGATLSHDIKITHPDKLLFPGGITKSDLVGYYQLIARWMLPHLRERPLALQRFPDGIDAPGFFQKSTPSYYPPWIPTVTLEKQGGTVRHVVCNDVDTLVYLANQACITPHIWLSCAGRPNQPDLMIFDLDPSDDDFALVIEAAQVLKQILDRVDLPVYLKTTGSRGLHAIVPLDATAEFAPVHALARRIAAILVQQDPGRFTTEARKANRRGRLFIDTNRNAYAQTAVAAYAVRPRPGAPVATPIDWAELRDKRLRPDGFTIRNIFGRLEKIENPWRDFWQRKASPAEARSRIDGVYPASSSTGRIAHAKT